MCDCFQITSFNFGFAWFTVNIHYNLRDNTYKIRPFLREIYLKNLRPLSLWFWWSVIFGEAWEWKSTDCSSLTSPSHLHCGHHLLQANFGTYSSCLSSFQRNMDLEPKVFWKRDLEWRPKRWKDHAKLYICTVGMLTYTKGWYSKGR